MYMHGVLNNTVKISAKTAEDFRFNLRDFYPGGQADMMDSIQLGDGANVVLDEYSTIGKEEMCKCVET